MPRAGRRPRNAQGRPEPAPFTVIPAGAPTPAGAEQPALSVVEGEKPDRRSPRKTVATPQGCACGRPPSPAGFPVSHRTAPGVMVPAPVPVAEAGGRGVAICHEMSCFVMALLSSPSPVIPTGASQGAAERRKPVVAPPTPQGSACGRPPSPAGFLVSHRTAPSATVPVAEAGGGCAPGVERGHIENKSSIVKDYYRKRGNILETASAEPWRTPAAWTRRAARRRGIGLVYAGYCTR